MQYKDASKKIWRKPKLSNLGNFSSFVKWGESHGKSPPAGDGNSGESMD